MALLLMQAVLVAGQPRRPVVQTCNHQPEQKAIPMEQQKKFTLEDLNFGGSNYRNMVPSARYYVWWGDELVRLEVDKVAIINKGRDASRELFTIDDVVKAVYADGDSIGINLLEVSFPYSDKPVASVMTPKRRVLYNFKTRRVEWSQSREGVLEWNSNSRVGAFLKDGNLWLRLADGEERQLSHDGSREIIYGQAVHRNEFGINKGTFFSTDGMRMAFYRMDQTMVADYPQVNTFMRMAAYEPDKYPMAGMASHEVAVGIHDICADKTVFLATGAPKNRYFTNISWSPDGKRLYLYEVNRAQNVAALDEYDALTGIKIRTIDTESDAKYVEPQHPITFLPWDDTKFIAWSQKDGYWHLYLYDALKGEEIRQITKGEWVVMDVLGFNKDTRSVLIKANEHSPLEHTLFAVNVENGQMSQIDGGNGVHEGYPSRSGRYIVDEWSRHDVPRAYWLTDVNKAVRCGWSGAGVVLHRSRNPWEGYAVPQFRTGTLTAADDSTRLYWRMVLPPDFDATKKYPAIVYVYGGPHANNVQFSWHANSRGWETYMAQQGYVIFVLDNRGSQYRGKEFEQATWHKLGQVEMEDQLKGVEYLRSLPYIDAERLGVHGWSFGGFMTISLMTTYPDVFKVGVAGGPVIDWKWYEVMYGERYMGTPEDNPEGYALTSLLDKAKNLKGRLQIITGMNDPVVVPQHALQFLNACNEAGTQPDFYVYPGEEHNMRGRMSVHLHERITRYFIDFLK